MVFFTTLLKKRSQSHKHGFTLIELLLVVVMTAILSVGGFASYINSQRNSRDSRRETDLQTIRQALELYRSANGVYPTYTGNTEGGLKTTLTGNNCYSSACMSTSSYPKDPQSSQQYYYRSAAGSVYDLCANLENFDVSTDPACGYGSADCIVGAATGCNYGLTQP